MKGKSSWSYRPYRPLLENVGDIYICRIAPGSGSVHFEWLTEPGEIYKVFYRLRDQGEYIFAGETAEGSWDITGLQDYTDYEIYVASGEKRSRVRLVRTGAAVGTVVNYLHPDDLAYSFSGRYLCSPSLLRHPDGYLLASMDLFKENHPQNLTLIFRSDDNGATWHYLSELMPCFWGKLFLHKGELYMLACSTEYGDLLIGKSTDGGKTFGTPSVLLRGSNGKNGNTGVHKNPQNVIIYNGRLYETLEWGAWENGETRGYYHASMVMSCDVDADLLDPESWHFTPPVKYDPNWPGTAKGESSGTIEGTLTVAPDGKLYNVMRYNIANSEPKYGLALSFLVNTEDPDAPLEYSHSIHLNCNHSKFMIQKDPVSGRYYTIGCRQEDDRIYARNLLSLFVSEDLENWRVAKDLIDYRHEQQEKVGFQYVDYLIEGEAILFLCRTAMNDAHNFHDANYQTFHRIENFRSL